MPHYRNETADEDCFFSILYQDQAVLVVNKPSGWVVNDSQTTANQTTLQSWLSTLNYEIAKDHTLRSGIVHRLDKETSGVIIIAKTPESFAQLQDQFKLRKTEKTYTALVHGKVDPDEGGVNVPIGRLPWNRQHFGVLPGGRQSTTYYKVINYYQDLANIYSLLEVHPITGRTHQIRVHLKYAGYPLVSDPLYTGKKAFKKDRVWCSRLFLHASSISFFHPTSGEKINFSAELPANLLQPLNALQLVKK